ncbi:polyketide antibiotic transporter [Microbacterium sp. Marseille-Q6648]|uniref:ABC transporter permease n=1 Tax=Microbacterium sp. Marseille-Q6648 TaxID=2937991 RepID=UPI00203D9328|nr:polyketide antibiotic transporter [Microbacterium sp. Marseille-Q6648]
MLVSLLGQRLRRDAVQLTVWAAAAALLTYGSAFGVADTFGTDEERRSLLALALANPVILLFRGLPSGAEEGAFLIFLILPFLCLMIAIMAGFLAVRHTRAEEETERADLVSATPAARTLPLIATCIHGVIACVLFAVAVALALMATGLPASGAATTGLALLVTGLAFFSLGAFWAQLVRSSRAANSLTVAVLLTTFLLAGIGNALGTPSDDLTRMQSSPLTWASPFGWAENVRPFADDDLRPLVPGVIVGALLIGAAALIHSRRDVGAGVVEARAARAEAGALLSTPWGLAWRLSAGSVVAWAIGAAVVGGLSTSLGSVVGEMATDNPAVAEILRRIAAQGSMDQGVLVTFYVMVGVLASCFGVQTVQRARQEEIHGTAEPTLATPVHRSTWLAAFLAAAVCGILVIVASAVAASAIALAVTGGESDRLRDAIVSGAGQVAAASVFVVLTAVVFTLLPRATISLGWALVIASAALALFGTIFGLDEALIQLSPFAAVPTPDGDGIDPGGVWALASVVLVGGVAALTLMRRRELAPAG